MANLFYNCLALFSLAYGAGHQSPNVFSLAILISVFFAIVAYVKRPIPRNRYRKPSIIQRIKRDFFTKKVSA